VPADLDPTRNLVADAVRHFRARTGIEDGVCGELIKKIPTGAGLGGGSSDAAATLRGLVTLFGVDPAYCSPASGAVLGSDVPFFLDGPAAIVSGVGDRVQPLIPRVDFHLVAVYPGFPVSTVRAYQWWDSAANGGAPPVAMADPDVIGGTYRCAPVREWGFRNAFDPVVCAHRPAVAQMLGSIRDAGALMAQVSGSGSVGIGVFTSRSATEEAMTMLGQRWPRAWMVEPLDHRPPIEVLS